MPKETRTITLQVQHQYLDRAPSEEVIMAVFKEAMARHSSSIPWKVTLIVSTCRENN